MGRIVGATIRCSLSLWTSSQAAYPFSPVCLNVVFLSLPRSFIAALLCSLLSKRGCRTVISHPAGHSVVTGFRATKKPAHKCVPTTRKKDRPIPCGVASHSCNRLCNSKSKLSFTLDHCRQFKAVLEAAVFSLSIPQALSGLQPFSQ